ncbi:REF/SRPP-like protein At3g05500 [Panicum virgatum]|uniref:Stress-related protein n=1 Tax=Panicum virgatum TaxID=38727 RepID=A0A8T0PQG8_PANVG|nr:REF/SRPP-like protein At3g05500 [Panicum virgatum]KAG2563325.1 hypothetical protein PVAP13_8KG322900 [Panicum virgatum]
MGEANPDPQAEAEENEMDQQEEGEVVVVQEQEQEQAPKLRYLGFVHVAAVQAVVCLAGLYGLAKDHAGPLRPCVDATEHAVKGVVGPVYRKFHGVPVDILAFVDRKVDDTLKKLGRHLPGSLKAASARTCAVARGVPEVARELTAEAKQSGVKGAARAAYAKAEPVAKGVYMRYEPTAEHLAVSTWRSLNGLPVFPHIAHIVVPAAGYCAARYNKVVAAAGRQGYTGARYLPTVPTERIAKVFASSSPEANGAAETK